VVKLNFPKEPRLAHHVTDRIYEAARRMNHKPEREGRLGMSQIGGCPRDLWAELRGVPDERPPDGRLCLMFEHGNSVEDLIVKKLLGAGYVVLAEDPETGKQFRLEDYDGNFVGHLDGRIQERGDDEWKLLEIKSANTKQFNKLKKLGYVEWNRKYAAQLQIYMGYAGLQDSLVVVMRKEDSETHSENVGFDPELFEELKLKAALILSVHELPDRPADATSQFSEYCRWCSRNRWCWGPLAGREPFDD